MPFEGIGTIPTKYQALEKDSGSKSPSFLQHSSQVAKVGHTIDWEVRELTQWEIDLVGVEFVRVDLVGGYPPATWILFLHEIAIPISQSSRYNWYWLCHAQWVILFSIWACLFFFFVICSTLIVCACAS